MLVHRVRRCTSIKPTSVQRGMFDGYDSCCVFILLDYDKPHSMTLVLKALHSSPAGILSFYPKKCIIWHIIMT